MERLAAEISEAEGLSKTLSWQTVQQWERGDSAPKRKRMETVARLLDLRITDLIATDIGSDHLPSKLVAQERAAYLPGFEPISVPLLATSASMGPGAEQHDDVVVGRLTLSPSWVSKTLRPLTKLENLRFIHGYGDSMEPTFVDGDILLVDAGSSDVKVDGIYVLEANDRLYIKRVRQRLDGSYEISSDNPTVKTVDVLTDGSAPVNVKGRVIWVWNGKKL